MINDFKIAVIRKFMIYFSLYVYDDVSLTSLFYACTGRTVAPLQLPDSQSFQPHHQTSISVFNY